MADIGSTLREARIRARIDMSEVEQNTKIRAKYLRAIENEEWDLLPGTVYAKSFLRSYGDYLGLDSRMLVEEYKRRYEVPVDHDPGRPVASLARERGPRAPIRPPRPALPPWAPIAAVLIIVVVILFVVGEVLPGKSKNPGTSAPRVTARHHHHRVTHRRPVSLPGTTASVTLQMTPTAPVYVCLVDGRGQRLIFEKTYTVGETIPSFTKRKLLLTLGNANVQLKTNGKPYPLAPSSNPIRLQVTAAAVQRIATTVRPTCP